MRERTAFDCTVAALDPAMAVVTVAAGGERAGCLVGFHSQCSIDPPRYALWLSKANRTYRVALVAEHLAAHFLAAADRVLAEHFGGETGDDVDKFAGIAWEEGPGGVPLLAACPHRMVLRRLTVLDEGGDHVCFVGEPVGSRGGRDLEPLRLSHSVDIAPGHEPDERPA